MAKSNIEKRKEKNKECYNRNKRTVKAKINKGDTVICKQKKNNKLTPKFDPEHYTVVHRKYSTITAERDGKTVTRNVSYFKKVLVDETEDEFENTRPTRRPGTEQPPTQEPSLRRSTRIRKPVERSARELILEH